MPFHDWSDKSFDWEALAECQEIILKSHKKGFLSPDCKQKYGTLRWYVNFGTVSLHNICYPGYAYYQFPKWLLLLDLYLIEPTLTFLFNGLFVWWQKKEYNRIYQEMLTAYPHIRDEILICADYPEFIDGAKNE